MDQEIVVILQCCVFLVIKLRDILCQAVAIDCILTNVYDELLEFNRDKEILEDSQTDCPVEVFVLLKCQDVYVGAIVPALEMPHGKRLEYGIHVVRRRIKPRASRRVFLAKESRFFLFE